MAEELKKEWVRSQYICRTGKSCKRKSRNRRYQYHGSGRLLISDRGWEEKEIEYKNGS